MGAVYQPQCLLREVAVDPRQAAVLFIDVQNLNCHRGGALYRNHSQEDLEGPEYAYWWARIDDCMGKWQQLQQAARGCGIEVMYTVIQSLTRDGRDRSLDYKISGFHVPPGCWDAKVVDSLQPGPDEIVLPKTSSSVFNSTSIDYLLRNMDKRFLLLAGCVTDQCVAHAVKDAADLGYLVTLVTDCCATYSAERHLAACQSIAGYCRQRTLDVLLEEFLAVTGAKPPPAPSGTGGPPGGEGVTAGVTSGGGVTGVTGGPGVTGTPPGMAGVTGVMPGVTPLAAGDGVTGSHQMGGMADVAAGLGMPSVTGGPPGMLVGDVMPAGGGPLLDGGMNGAGGYKRALFAPGMGYGTGLSGAGPMDMETYSGDNFSPGLLPGEQSDGMEEEDDYEAGAGGSRGRGRPRGSGRRSRAAAAALPVLGGGGVEKKQVYFEYAKPQWESEQEFLLPNGQTWVDITVRGDPKSSERGLVYCKLCRHYSKQNVFGKGYSKQNVFGKGYRAGKRSALKEHMQTKDHKELVEALMAGVIPMPEQLQDQIGGLRQLMTQFGESLQGQAHVSAEEAAAAITTAFSQAAAAAGVDSSKIAEALAAAAAVHGSSPGALVAAAEALASAQGGGAAGSSSSMPQQRQQQQQNGLHMPSGGMGASAAALKALTNAITNGQQQRMLA
ncbi:hypothetical protein OEZ86_007199 [Tetradesmus obliquus]|nr:hypothetical protein OEZ86_007199 [Tetradesmus obliquus]